MEELPKLPAYYGDDPMFTDMLFAVLADQQRQLVHRYFPEDPQVLLQLGPKVVPQEVWAEYHRLEREKFRLRQVMATHKILAAVEAPESVPDTPMITEAEAARLMGRSVKHLGNLRRDGRIPRNLYQQLAVGGKVMFYREKFVAWLANKSSAKKD